jgi:ribosomal-protein-alanine N-acetyltransferase
MSRVEIRPMMREDLPAVEAIEHEGFSLPWPKDAFAHELENALARYLVLVEDGVVAAYGGMWMILGSAEITSISTAPWARRRGYGERLLRALMTLAYEELEITEMTLEVRVSNLPAQALYTKLGFVTEGKRDKYYEDNKEDALIMWCHDTRPYWTAGDSDHDFSEG